MAGDPPPYPLLYLYRVSDEVNGAGSIGPVEPGPRNDRTNPGPAGKPRAAGRAPLGNAADVVAAGAASRLSAGRPGRDRRLRPRQEGQGTAGVGGRAPGRG